MPTTFHRLSLPPALVLATALALTGADTSAQAFRADLPLHPGTLAGPVLVEGEVSNPEVVPLLTGLAKIESDLQLGMLFLADGLTNPSGSHFTHPRAETYPMIKDGLAKAGIADFEAQLVALEAGGDSATVTAAYTAAVAAIMGARSTLRPSVQDLVASIADQTRAVVGEINPAGPTEVQNYQDAWAMLLVARNQIDLLSQGQDAPVIQAAKELGLAIDDIIISMPDPAASGPVTFDAAPLLQVITGLDALAGTV